MQRPNQRGSCLGREVQQSPRSVLRIALVEVGEKVRVSEVLETRGVVGHDIGRSWEVGSSVAVAVVALMGTLPIAEVSCGTFAADGAFPHSRDGRSVVRSVDESGMGAIMSGAL